MMMQTNTEKSTDTKLVSVIIPVYKTEKYLPACVESVLHQSYPNLEIIMVNDGSPDNAPAMCDSLAEQYENIRVVHKENGGPSSARNAGTAFAKGTFILYLDSDDTLSENAIQDMVEIAVRESSDAVLPDRYYRTEEETGKSVLRYHFPENCRLKNPVEFALQVLLGMGRASRASAVLYRRSVLQENQILFPLGLISEDVFFNLQFLCKAKKLSFIESPTLNYRKHFGTITSVFHPEFLDTILRMDDAVQAFLEETCVDTAVGQQKRAAFLMRNCVCYLLNMEKKANDQNKKERQQCFMNVAMNERLQAALQISDEVPYFQNPMSKYYFKLMYRLLRRGHYSAAQLLNKAVANI